MKKKPVNEDSDEFEADEPEEFEESGSDWDPEEEVPTTKKRKGPPAKKTPAKKGAPPKKKKADKPPSDEEDDEEEVDEEEEEEEEDGDESDESGAEGHEKGSFVVLKSDFQSGGNPPLWKIDGKALLQKYIPFEQDGKTLYKNTSTYSGWTQNNRNDYASAPVSFVVQGKKEIIIEFNRDKVDLNEKKEEGEKGAAKADA